MTGERLIHAAYTPLTRFLHASYTPLTRLSRASHTPLTRLLHASQYAYLIKEKVVAELCQERAVTGERPITWRVEEVEPDLGIYVCTSNKEIPATF